MREVVLYTRRLCGLCDEAEEQLRFLSGELGFTIVKRDIDDEADLRARFNEVVPVVAVGDDIVAQAPVTYDELRDRLSAALA